MIQFKCRCSQRFSVPEGEAGDDLQCPSCGLLLTVPTHSEVTGITDDGIYAVDDVPRAEDKQRVRELGYVFKTGTRDAAGEEIDLRITREELVRVGVPEEPRSAAGEPFGLRPRYDPETGEFLAPIEVKPHPADLRVDPSEIPLAKPALTYATGAIAGSTGFGAAIPALFRPVNLMVMVIVLAIQSTVQATMFVTASAGLFFVSPLLLLIQIGMFCHYGNVIDEVGPGESDELPRPMRDLRFREDLWTPFTTLIGSAVICYMPMVMCLIAASNDLQTFLGAAAGVAIAVGVVVCWRIAWMLATNDWYIIEFTADVMAPLLAAVGALVIVVGPGMLLAVAAAPPAVIYGGAVVLATIGTFFVPAVMLTIATSGSNANLRPDRLIGVIRISGRRYIVPVVAWAIAAPAYVAALSLMTGVSVGVGRLTLKGGAGGLLVLGLDGAILCIAIYAMHLVAWELGQIYRASHAEFPWIYQMFVSARKHRTGAGIARDVAARRAASLQRSVVRRSPGPR